MDQHPAVTVPLAFEPLLLGERTGMTKADKPGIWWLNLMGRLKPGSTIEQARDSLNGAFQTMALEVMPPPRREGEPAELDAKDYPRLIAQSGSRGMMESRKIYSATIYWLFIVVGLVLLIACANVANLLLKVCCFRRWAAPLEWFLRSGARARLKQWQIHTPASCLPMLTQV